MFREERREREGRGCLCLLCLMLAGCGSWLAGLLVACRAGGLLVERCLAVCSGRPLPLRTPMRFGRGVRPSSVATRCCFSRSCPSGFRPWLRCSVLAIWGFCFLALLGCWLRQGSPLTFPRRVCFFPFVIYYNSMTTRYKSSIYRIGFLFLSGKVF